MQYALIETQGRRLLISANEMQSLNTFQKSIVDAESLNDPDCPFHICYGCYMPQPGVNEEKALEGLMFARDHFLGFIHEDKCHVIAFFDAVAMDSEHIGNSIRIPFSALLKATAPIIEQIGDRASRQAVTGFLRYKNRSPATNILNRPGIIALKGIEHRMPQADSLQMIGDMVPGNWRKHIDKERAKRIAHGIK